MLLLTVQKQILCENCIVAYCNRGVNIRNKVKKSSEKDLSKFNTFSNFAISHAFMKNCKKLG